jgi:hypothetical protein
MPSHVLTDSANDIWLDKFAIKSPDLGFGFAPAAEPRAATWSVTKRTLHGGRREGVDLIEVNNGALAFSVVPTRGMGIWRGEYLGQRLGWTSPITDGPVHPAFVNLLNWGGLGWLEGFDELLARCGLENNGAAYTEGSTTFGLHGKIANIPARFVAVHASDGPEGEIVIEGHVDESKLFSTQVRLITRISTQPGSNRLTVRDEFVNLGDTPQEFQILYHWNLGPPFLEEGSRFVAPAKTIAPRNARAAEGIGHFDVFGAPEPGFNEQVYFAELLAAQQDGRTLAMLRDHAGDKAVVLRFSTRELPVFTLWKNSGGPRSGFVTGLEPGINYPNPRPFEKARGRVETLAVGGRRLAEMSLEVLGKREDVAMAEAEIAAIQRQAAPVIHKHPIEPFAPIDS